MKYLLRHFQVFLHTLGSIFRHPVPTLLTVTVLGITLSLPIGLYLLTHNLELVSNEWQGKPQATVYLKKSATEQDVSRLDNWFSTQRSWITEVQYVEAKDALEEFKFLSGLGQALDVLNENPLPNMFILEMSETLPVEDYQDELTQLEEDESVEELKYDLEWVQRLQAILNLAQRTVWMVAGLLGLGALLIVSNTMRLSIANKKDEIMIINRIGATNTFIRRPFLYTGFIQGLLGALLAWGLIQAALHWLNEPVQRLANLYASDYQLTGLPMQWVLLILLTGGLLGWIASWATVSRHLSQLYPS